MLLWRNATLFSENFKDSENGWQKYFDVESFVDWYLINEISKNFDATFWSSCYFHLQRGGKLKMGPIWDFDISFGNVEYAEARYYDDFWVTNTSWYYRLFQDPFFVNRVKERFDFFYNKLPELMEEINQNAQYLQYSVVENNGKWNTFYNYNWPNYDIWGNYQNEVQSMKLWIQERFEWLKQHFDAM